MVNGAGFCNIFYSRLNPLRTVKARSMKDTLRSLLVRALTAASTFALIIASFAPRPARAVDKTWDGEGADDFWQTDANWDPTGGGGTKPATNDFLIFDGGVRTTPNNNFPAGTPFGNITFGA